MRVLRSASSSLDALEGVEAGYSGGALSAVMGVGCLEIEDGKESMEEVMLAEGEIAVENELGKLDNAVAVAKCVNDPGFVEGMSSEVSCAKEGAGSTRERNRSGLERRCIRLLHLHGQRACRGPILARGMR